MRVGAEQGDRFTESVHFYTRMTEILYDTRWFGNHGIGRFARQMFQHISGLSPFAASRRPVHPLDPWFLGFHLRRAQPLLYFSPGYNSPVGWPGRYVFTLHDLNHLCVPDNSNALKRAYYQQIIRPACHRAEFVLTVSEYSREEIRKWSGVSHEKIINVGNGVGAPFFPQGARHEPGFPYFLYVGSYKPHKNLPRLLQAYAHTGLQKEIRLLIAGYPDDDLISEIRKCGLHDAVTFRHARQDEELAALYRGAVALLFPSLYEGFGLPPLEAMACGIPVLTSNVCAISEVVADAGLLVEPLLTDSIKEGILKIAGDKTLRRDLRVKGLQRASEFTWAKAAAKTAEILQAALN